MRVRFRNPDQLLLIVAVPASGYTYTLLNDLSAEWIRLKNIGT